MFRLNKPSSDQFTNHIEGTFIRCVHCGPTVCTSTEYAFNIVCELAWWWLNEPKHVARFI